MDRPRVPQQLAAEMLGTAFLVFAGAGSIPAILSMSGSAALGVAGLSVVAFTFAAVIAATVVAFGSTSGNHINPAVTVGLAIAGRFPWRRVPEYVAAQLVGATVGALAIVGVLGTAASDLGLGVTAYGPGVGHGQAFVAELVGTLILVLTVIMVVSRGVTAGAAGIAIGLVVFAIIIPVGPVTGAAINPARLLGPMLVQQPFGGELHWNQVPVYLAAQACAAVAAAVLAVGLTRGVGSSPVDRVSRRGTRGAPLSADTGTRRHSSARRSR